MKPTTVDGFKNIGLKLEEIGEGCFRRTYSIADLPLVVKFPVGTDGDGKRHTNIEVKKLKQFRKFSVLRPCLPKLYYHDKKKGIVVMHLYERKYTEESSNRFYTENAAFTLLGRLIQTLTKKSLSDLHGNTILTKRNVLKFIDLGY